MRSLSRFAAAIVAVTLLSPSVASAQRHARHQSFTRPARDQSPAVARCTEDCDDYSLTVVSAVLPTAATDGSWGYVTVVIQNRGMATAPVSVISVAPQNHLSLARHSSLGALAPGERATVQLPVEIGPDGTPCISINITTAPVPAAPEARFLAAGPAAPSTDVPAGIQWAGADELGFGTPFRGQLDAMFPGLVDIGDLGAA